MSEDKVGNTNTISVGLNKKFSKKGNSCTIPLETLGFKSKVFYDAHQYVPRRRYNKASKYEQQKRKQNFRARLSCIINPSEIPHQQLSHTTFSKRGEWNKIKYVVFKSKQEIFCCICLSQKFIAPQITFCGHVYCWHCLLMHYEKSLKATSCPVCNEVFEIQQVRTCQPLYLPPLTEGSSVKFGLKCRSLKDATIYKAQTLLEETELSHIVRMKNTKILEKYQQQHIQIINEMKRQEDPQTQKYLTKIIQKSNNKIQSFKVIISQEKKHYFKPGKQEIVNDGIMLKFLNLEIQSGNKDIVTFYQEVEGRKAYLHPICDKYLRKNFESDNLPLYIEQQITLKQQTEYSSENIKKYKYLNHLPENQDFDFIFIKMNQLLDYKLYQQFKKEFQNYKKKKQQILKREQANSLRLKQKYEKDQQYLRELRKMEESQFHDISVPTNMVNLQEIQDTRIFPSLFGASSQVDKTEQNKEVYPKSQIPHKNKKKPVFTQDDFPQLELAIKLSIQESAQSLGTNQQSEVASYILRQQSLSNEAKEPDFPEMQHTKSQQPTCKVKGSKMQQQQNVRFKNKGKKKRKEKFVDVTQQFFQQRQNDYQQY